MTSRRFVSCPFDTVSVRLNSAFLHDAIALAEHDDAGLPVLDLMFGDVGEAHDGEDVPSFSLEGSRAVEDDLARTGIAGDGVGLKAISVCHIAAQDALVRYEPAFLHQVGGDGQAAFVLQIAICDCGAVNLRFSKQICIGGSSADRHRRALRNTNPFGRDGSHDGLSTILDIQTSKFVITSRLLISCSISCRPPE